jgi:hypothetical protein
LELPPPRPRTDNAGHGAIPPFEFENWAVIALGGVPNKVQIRNMGIGK